jgi:RES domain-containing protein
VVDFRRGYSASEWNPLWEDFYCDWRELWFNQHIEPPSWLIGDTVIAAGASGVLFHSSLLTGGTNLVLFPKTYDNSDSITVYDPDHSLPKNQDSWT